VQTTSRVAEAATDARIQEKPTRPLGGIWVEIAGLGVVGATIGWVLLSEHLNGGRAGPIVALLAASAGAYLVGRLTGLLSRTAIPLVLVAAAAVIMAGSPSGALSRSATGGAFDYPNARAAFFALGAASAATIGVLWRPVVVKIAAFGLMGLFGVVPFFTGTHGGMVAVVGITLVVSLVSNARRARIAIAIAAAAFVLTVGMTTFLAERYHPGGHGLIDRIVDHTPLREHRVELWHQALVLIERHPVTGVGPRRFAQFSPEARRDVDSRRARNEFLQFGAETGAIGMALLVLLFVWGFARLRFSRFPDAAVAVAAVALAGVGMHACVDYVLHFPAIPLALAALVGSSIGRRRRAVDVTP
jgi:O-antigen ligase